jgi:putative nucleotidyltransferase with HDIG domain
MAVPESEACFVDADALRIGLFVHLDLGWMRHPFALSSFKITAQDQIETIRGLGLERIRWSPEKSDPPPQPAGEMSATVAVVAAEVPPSVQPGRDVAAVDAVRQRREQLSLQRASLDVCERQFAGASRLYRKVLENAERDPAAARQQTEESVGNMVGKMLEQEESAIRLLSENVGDKGSLHPVNVTVISLLLGRAMDLDAETLRQLGVGALLHDIGKVVLPERLRWHDPLFSKAERNLYQEHVAHGVALGRRMSLPEPVLAVIAQHHELADGKGYPAGLVGEAISPLTRIVALVNHYDSLCNPLNPAQAVTPHEALSMIFARMKRQFDSAVLMLFVRMMGVYPPGSVVELNDGRFGLVVSVNSSRPLKPRIVVFEPRVPRDEALIHDLEHCPELGIQRSLKPMQLPKAAYDYLSPRQRTCYFFERAHLVTEGAE